MESYSACFSTVVHGTMRSQFSHQTSGSAARNFHAADDDELANEGRCRKETTFNPPRGGVVCNVTTSPAGKGHVGKVSMESEEEKAKMRKRNTISVLCYSV